MLNAVIIAFISYLLLPGILLGGGVEDNHSLIDQSSSNTLKGIFSIYLVIHHFVQKMAYRPLLEPMAWFGFLIVGWFFLTSGYGTYLHFEKKGVRDFWAGKVKRIWLPFVIAVSIEGILKIVLLHKEATIPQVLFNALTLRMIDGGFMWYIFTQIIMYVCFFFPYRFFTQKRMRYAVMIFIIAAFDVTNIHLHRADYNWVTCSCFAIGVLIGEHKDTVRDFFFKLKKRNAVIISSIVFIAISVVFSWCHSRWEVFVLVPIAECMLVIMTSFIRFRSKAFNWLGTLSYEIYITQYCMIEIGIAYLGKSWFVLFLTILASIVFAFCVSRASRIILNTWENSRRTITT